MDTWIHGKTRQDKIRNEKNRKNVIIGPIMEKMMKNRFSVIMNVKQMVRA